MEQQRTGGSRYKKSDGGLVALLAVMTLVWALEARNIPMAVAAVAIYRGINNAAAPLSAAVSAKAH
jgi:hypothetical protein